MSLFAVFYLGGLYLPGGTNRPLFKFGVILSVLSVAIIALAIYSFRKFGKSETRFNFNRSTVLVRQNIYAVVRHPHYLGLMVLSIGFMALSQHVVVLAAGLTFNIFILVQVSKEEEYCRERFGDAYERYAATVPSFNIFAGLWRRMHRATI